MKSYLASSSTGGTKEQFLFVSEGHDPSLVEGQHDRVVEVLLDRERGSPDEQLVPGLTDFKFIFKIWPFDT
jgi:hypothetical protein